MKKNKTQAPKQLEDADEMIEDSYSWEAAQQIKKKTANPLDLFQQ